MGAQLTSQQLAAAPVDVRAVEPRVARLVDRFVACPLVPLEGGDWFAWQDVGDPVAVDRLTCWAPCGAFDLSVDGLGRLSEGWVRPPDHVPDEVVLGLMESACAPVFTALSAYFGEGTRVDALTRGPLAERRPDTGLLALGFVVGRPGQGVVARGWLHAATDVLRRANFDQPRSAWSAQGLALPLRVRVELGCVSLPLETLRGLRQGDVLRLDAPVTAQGPLPVMLHVGPGHVFLGRAQDRQLVVESSMKTSLQPSDRSAAGASPEPRDATESAADVLPALGALPCTVHVELAELRMTVAQVADLRPGRTLPLGTALDERAVSLHVNGHCVGRGELVMLGTELAVLLTQTAPQD